MTRCTEDRDAYLNAEEKARSQRLDYGAILAPWRRGTGVIKGDRKQASPTQDKSCPGGAEDSACSSTVCVVLSCLSGGYPYLRKMRFTSTRSCARTFSRSVQSIVTLLRTVVTNSRAIAQMTS
jgi:hypothetical protein